MAKSSAASFASPLILIHGALGAAEQLASLHEALVTQREAAGLSETQAPILIHELAGHGQTPVRKADGLAIEAMAEDLAALLDECNWSGVDVFGYSMGGYVALHLAHEQPERIGRVLTLGTKLAWDPATAARETKLLDPDTIQAKVPAFAETLAQRHGEARWRALCHETAALLRNLGDRPLLDAAAFARIEQPVCIGVGDRDGTVSIEECVAAYRALPHGALAVLPRTPHPLDRVPTHELVALITGVLEQG
jgi:pimeloyl-ACP methyl ester carboxylesterase